MVGWGKSLYINIVELKAVFLALKQFKDQCQNQTMLVAADNSASLYKQKGRNPRGDVCSPVENHDLVRSLQNNATSQAHSSVPKCDGRLTLQVISNSINRMVTVRSVRSLKSQILTGCSPAFTAMSKKNKKSRNLPNSLPKVTFL